MNPYLAALQPYPFEKLNALKSGIVPEGNWPPVLLSIGEPKHAPPEFVIEILTDPARLARDLATYPVTRGSDALREAIAGWIGRRFGAKVDPAREILPVAGTREALFSFGQAVLSGAPGSLAILPNPFYQIYEGAVLLRGFGLGTVRTAVPVFARQPDRDHPRPRHARLAPGTIRSPRLRDRRRRVLFGDLPRRIATTDRTPPGGRRDRPDRLSQLRRVPQPEQALQPAGPALRVRGR
jgi:hypothetical protein